MTTLNPNPATSRRLRLLIAEDDPADAELLVAVLKRAGYPLSFEVVDRLEDYRERLRRNAYDVVVSDHNLRTWTGMDALEVLRKEHKDVPFIVVTAALGDEAAVEYVKRGATDYVLKHRMERVPVAVGAALRERAHFEATARLQEEVLAAKRHWELTFDSVPDPVLVIGEDRLIRLANRAVAELLGTDFSQIIGRPCYEVLHGTAEPPPDCPHQALLATGQPARGDREECRLGKTFEITTTPLRDSWGTLAGCVQVMRDVTARRHAESALRDSEQRYRTLFESNPNPMWIYDRETLAFLAVNDAAVHHYGYSRDDFGRMTIRDIRPPSEVEALRAHLEAGHSSYSSAKIWKHRQKDGTVIDVEISSHALDWLGRPAKMVLALDVTESRQLEEQLQRSQKMEAVGRLAGGVAHDFNNLLGVILGYSDLALQTHAHEEKLAGQISEIRKASQRAADLTRQLLAFSRQQVLEPRVLDLNAVVHDFEKMLRRLIGEDIDLRTALHPNLGRVKADPGQLEQVLMNLAVNARDAMPHGGRLTIETANVELDQQYTAHHYPVVPGRYVLLAVSDTGTGMDETVRAKIFEPFFTTKEKGKGTGLGLPTVYGIVKQSGGYVWVYSEPGAGATFKIYLPLAQGEPELPAHAEAPVGRGNETILLVEDEEALRRLTRQILESYGYTVLEAENAPRALELANAHAGPLHLLLTDVVMPGMSGRQLATELSGVHPEARVLYVSGYTDNAIVHHGVLRDGVAFLQKPYTQSSLARKVREVLQNSSRGGVA